MQTPDYDTVATGAVLKKGMEERGMSVEELAYKCGFSVEAIRSWLSGRRAMTLDSAIKVCEVLDWSLDKLTMRREYATQN